MHVRIDVAVAALLLAISIGPSTVAAEEPTPGSTPAAATQRSTDADAIRFREAVGFDSSASLVAAAREDDNYNPEPYGVPLSQGEIDELVRRANVQRSMEEVIVQARKDPSFAGAYIDQLNRGRPVFLFTDVVPSRRDTLAAQLPSGSDVQVMLASRTERELVAAGDVLTTDIAALADTGIDVVRVAIAPSLNTLRVGVHGVTESAAQALRDRYGAHILVFEDDVAHADACLGTNNCRPIKGGISINEASGSPSQCTSGFVAKRSDTGGYVLVTAGHCIEAHGGFNAVWRHNNMGFGRALRETWQPGASGDADVGLITIQSPEVAQMTNKNHLRRGGTSITNVVGVSSPIEGGQACRIGAMSGQNCGLITDPDASRVSTAPGGSMTVLHTSTVDFDSISGDSGGAVFYYVSGGVTGNVIALGTHVHSEEGPSANEGWFSSQFWGSWNYTTMWGYNYSICTTATC